MRWDGATWYPVGNIPLYPDIRDGIVFDDGLGPAVFLVVEYGTPADVMRYGCVWGDGDGDGDVDLTDFGLFQLCYGNEAVDNIPSCRPVDFDSDGDVDLADFAFFSDAFTGSE